MTIEELIGDPRKEMQYLKAREVAKLLRVGLNLIYNLIRRGDLPAKRVGRFWRIHRNDIEALGHRVTSLAGGGGPASNA